MPDAIVLQLERTLCGPPEISEVEGYAVRTFSGPDDVAHWLRIRRLAFAGERVAVRDWTEADFNRELTQKPWWSPERLWFVEPAPRGGLPVGTIALASRDCPGQAVYVLHWLAVVPGARRRGLGRRLVAEAEKSVWERGARRIALETHAAWIRALDLYRNLGYREAPPADSKHDACLST